MRYNDTHKQKVREKLVRAAAECVRAEGPDGVSVARIMAEVGLTHGGFYAHFPSKEALVAAAIEEAFDQSRVRFARMTEGMTPSQALVTFIDTYVSFDHRNNPQHGCPIATLSSDLPRQGPLVRAAFDAGVTGLIERVGGWLAEQQPAVRRSLASSILAEMAGAVSMARAVSDHDLAEQLLEASRTRVLARAGLSAVLKSEG